MRITQGIVMSKKMCPNCRSENIDLFMGFQMGTYNCKECNYIGSLILEEETD